MSIKGVAVKLFPLNMLGGTDVNKKEHFGFVQLNNECLLFSYAGWNLQFI